MNFSQNRRNLTKLWAPAPAWKSKLFKETEFLISNQAIQKSRQIFSECVIYWRFWINKKKTGLKENGKGGKTPMYGCNKILLCCMRIYISEFLPPSHLYPRGRKYFHRVFCSNVEMHHLLREIQISWNSGIKKFTCNRADTAHQFVIVSRQTNRNSIGLKIHRSHHSKNSYVIFIALLERKSAHFKILSKFPWSKPTKILWKYSSAIFYIAVRIHVMFDYMNYNIVFFHNSTVNTI